ncbi:hypothetical protein HYW58_00640 [Candidatus Kaiserbacteria bacterium]|nr:hypothetical protein [Candidatus Kaiserbacteria bacterium]
MINVEVTKNNNESATSLVRRFTKRMQGSGVLSRVRSVRYRTRPNSDFKKKKRALRKLERRAAYELLYKQGKIAEQKPGRRGRGRF